MNIPKIDVKSFLPGILGGITGIGEKILAGALADVRGQVDAAAALKAADVMARVIFKGLGAVAHPNTGLSLDQRKSALRALAAVVSGACRGLGDAVMAFAEAQAAREDARSGDATAALAAREAAEAEITADLRDLALLASGRAPHDTD